MSAPYPRLGPELARYLSRLPDPKGFLDHLHVYDLDERDLKNRTKRTKFQKDLKEEKFYLAGWWDGRPPPYEAPEFFSYAKAIKGSVWCLHLTKASPFTAFDRGVCPSRGNFALSRKQKPLAAQCPSNLTRNWFDAVYGFAFPLTTRGEVITWQRPEKNVKGLFKVEDMFDPNFSTKVGKYGGGTGATNAVLFKTDDAVVAYHKTDDETQVIFPICSEYSAVALTNLQGSGYGDVITPEGLKPFRSLLEVIRAVEVRPLGANAGVAGASRSTSHARWAIPPYRKSR